MGIVLVEFPWLGDIRTAPSQLVVFEHHLLEWRWDSEPAITIHGDAEKDQ